VLVYLLTVHLPNGMGLLGGIALALVATWILAGLFAPVPAYRITGAEEMLANDSAEYLRLLEALVDAQVNRTGRLEVLTNGPNFYEAEFAAIAGAQQSVNLEAYVFQKGRVATRLRDALTERARAGVQVNVVLDAFGSLGAGRSFFRPLIEAGGKVRRYNGLTWYRIMRMDNRTHRELVIIDGKIGFIGGAGIADHWYGGSHGNPQWRDTMVRVEGESVANLQATFAENWLSACGELLIGDAYFPDIVCPDPMVALVVNSTPTVGGSTRARVLFQLLVAAARRSISITTPYFLPDPGMMRELCRAVERGVRVRILVPGRKSDHMVTRSTSRGGYGELLKAGATVFEYQPAMIHAKILVVDEAWAVVGSTNFDYRSFGINDEVNLAVQNREIALRLESDMAADLELSRSITLEEWRHRPVTERATELLGWVIARQQ
jgi:cardiolipin synthase